MSNIQKIHNVILAFDGSPHAQAAIQLLADIPLARCEEPSEITQVTVISVLPTQYITGHEQLQASLDQACETMRTKGLKIQGILKAGNPPVTINNLAQELNAELIIIGAKGLRATLGILLGGVAQQVVEYAHCPVLVVRAPYAGLCRALFITDGSEYSMRALNYIAPGPASRFCPVLPNDTIVHVMHVMPPVVPPEAAMRAWTIGPEVIYPAAAQPFDLEALAKEEEERGNKILAEADAALRAEGIQSQTILERGDAATHILEYLKKEHIDLVICGTRGWGAVSGWFMGSVSRKLVHYAPCSVLTIK